MRTLGDEMADAYCQVHGIPRPFDPVAAAKKTYPCLTDKELELLKDLATEMEKQDNDLNKGILFMQLVALVVDMETVKYRECFFHGL